MISSRLNEQDGWLSVWWEDRDPAISPGEVARQFHEYILKSGIPNAVVGSETPAVARALLELPGFSVLGEERRYERPWPSGVKAPDITGIRPATKDDAATISRILDESFGEAMGGIFPPERCANELFQEDWHNWLITDGGEMAGYACAIHDGDEGVVNFIAIVQRAQGRGLGKRLMDLMLAELDRKPHKKIALTCESHRTRALRLYERYGFKPTEGPLVNVKWNKP